MDAIARDADSLAPQAPRGRRTLAFVRGRGRAARPTLFALLVGACAWELVSRLWQIPFLPPLSNVLRATALLIASGQVIGYVAASIVALLVGYGIAVVAGVGLGLLMGRYRKVEYALGLYINALLATPKIVLVPVLFAIFGVSRSVQVAVVFLSAFFIITVSTMGAVRASDATHLEMARSFGANERQVFSKVLLPGSMPLTMAGLRLGMSRAVKGMISGEMLIAVFGLGGLLTKYGAASTRRMCLRSC